MFFHRVRIAARLTGALLAGLTLPGAVVAAGQGERPVHVFVLGAPAPAADLAAALSRILPAPHEQRREREPVCGRSLPCAFDTSRAASARRTYALHVARRHEDVVKAVVAGAVPMHGAILAASASADLAPRAREQLALALRAGLPGLVVYLTPPDAEDGQGARAAWPRLRALLDDHGLAGNATPVIRGSALKALEGDTSEQGEGSIVALAQALDRYIPEPERAIDGAFLMPVEDVFSIPGRGTVATGRVERGVIRVGEEVEIVGIRATRRTTCTGVEMFRKLLDEGVAGDNIGVLLRGMKRDEIERGQVLAQPGSITPHTHFEALLYVLSKEEGGRHTPFFSGYRPQFYFRTTDVTGSIELAEGVEMVMPGDNVQMTAKLVTPLAMEEGSRFAVREGGRTVGAGIVSRIVE